MNSGIEGILLFYMPIIAILFILIVLIIAMIRVNRMFDDNLKILMKRVRITRDFDSLKRIRRIQITISILFSIVIVILITSFYMIIQEVYL